MTDISYNTVAPFHILIIDKLSFHISHVILIGLFQCSKIRCDSFSNGYITGGMKLKKYYVENQKNNS